MIGFVGEFSLLGLQCLQNKGVCWKIWKRLQRSVALKRADEEWLSAFCDQIVLSVSANSSTFTGIRPRNKMAMLQEVALPASRNVPGTSYLH